MREHHEILESKCAVTQYKKGVRYYRIAKYKTALIFLNESINIDENNPHFYLLRALCHEKMGNLRKSIMDYDTMLRLDPRDSNCLSTHFNRGSLYNKLGEHDNAIRDYTRSIELKIDVVISYTNRASIYSLQNKYAQAIKDYTKAVAIDPNHRNAYYNRGCAHFELGKYHLAIKDYTKTIELDSKFAMAYHNRGNAYSALSEFDKAISDYNKAIELDRTSSNIFDTYYNLSLVYDKVGDKEKSGIYLELSKRESVSIN